MWRYTRVGRIDLASPSHPSQLLPSIVVQCALAQGITSTRAVFIKRQGMETIIPTCRVPQPDRRNLRARDWVRIGRSLVARGSNCSRCSYETLGRLTPMRKDEDSHHRREGRLVLATRSMRIRGSPTHRRHRNLERVDGVLSQEITGLFASTIPPHGSSCSEDRRRACHFPIHDRTDASSIRLADQKHRHRWGGASRRPVLSTS